MSGFSCCSPLTAILAIALAIFVARKLYPRSAIPTENWEGRYTFTYDHLVRPSSLEEIVSTVKEVNERGGELKVVGAGHSWSDIASPRDVMMTLSNYTGIVKVNRKTKEITAKGGTLLSEINEELEKHGLGLSVIPSISSGTIAGTIATGTHSTGINYRNIPSYVVELEIVSGTGTVYRANRHSNSEIFNASLVSLGMLGVITEITIQCESAYNLHEVVTLEKAEDVVDRVFDVIKSADHVKLWFEINSGMVQVYRINRTQESRRNHVIHWVETIRVWILEISAFFMSRFPLVNTVLSPLMVHSGRFLPVRDQINYPPYIFNIPFDLPRHPESEYSVPIEQTKDKLMEFLKIAKHYMTKMAFNLAIEIRFVKADDIWMSPAQGRDSAFFTCLTYNPVDEMFMKFIEEVRQLLDGRPHWGKLMLTDTEKHLKPKYPNWDDFLRVRNQMDPKRIFRNEYLERVFPSIYASTAKEL